MLWSASSLTMTRWTRIIQEHTEDVEKLMAITGSREAGAYMRTSSGTTLKTEYRGLFYWQW